MKGPTRHHDFSLVELPAASRREGSAFSLVELLVVVAIIGLLATMLMPSLGRARELARSAVCSSQLDALATGNQQYAAEHKGLYVPAASDIFWGAAGNLHRWHGTRQDVNSPFDPARGPLAPYVGFEGRVKQCPSFTDFRNEAGAVAYEAGSGGYGYSDLYVGSQFWHYGFYHNSPGQRAGAPMAKVTRPGETVMFTDAAMGQAHGAASYYVEESFCYCPFALDDKGSVTSAFPRQPSIHFRHLDRVNVAFCDGHVAGRDDFRSITRNVYGANPEQMMVGWFGPNDNSLFDLK